MGGKIPIGIPVVFTIHSRDQYGNPMLTGGLTFFILIKMNDNSALWKPNGIVDNEDGTYTVTYIAEATGPGTIEIQRNGQLIRGLESSSPCGKEGLDACLPIDVEFVAGPTLAAESIAMGAGLCNAVAGETTRFQIQARDYTGADKDDMLDKFTFTVNGVLQKDGVVPVGAGLYEATYTYEKAGPLSIAVLHRGENVPLDVGEDSECVVVPGEVNPSETVVTGQGTTDGDEISAGVPISLRIEARDLYGNPVSEEDLLFTAEVTVDGETVTTTSTFLESGVYLLDYTVTKAGSTGSVRVMLGDTVYFETDGAFSVAAGEARLSQSTDTFSDQTYTAGVASIFEVVVRDEFGNVRSVPGDASFLEVEQVSELTGETTRLDDLLVNMAADGTHVFSLTPRVSGILRLVAKFPAESLIAQKTMPVSPGPPSAANSVVSGSGFDAGGVAGTTTSFQVQAYDNMDPPNRAELPPGTEYTVEFQGPNGIVIEQLPIVHLGNGLYEISYIPPSTGSNYDLSITVSLGGETVMSTDATIYNEFAAVDPGRCVIINQFGQEVADQGIIKGAEVAEQFQFAVLFKDVNGVAFTSKPSSSPEPFAAILGMNPFAYTGEWIPNTGKYGITLLQGEVTVAGQYTVIAKVCTDPNACPDGPYTSGYTDAINSGVFLQVRPGPAVASKSTAVGLGLKYATVGIPATFTITSYDEFGNSYFDGPDGAAGPLTWYDGMAGPDDYIVEMRYESQTTPGRVENNYDGTYTVEYTPLKSDPILKFSLYVFLESEENLVGGDVFQVEVKHGTLSPQKTTLETPYPDVEEAGEDINFVIEARDIEGNDYFTPDVTFTVILTPDETAKERGAVEITGTSYYDGIETSVFNRFVILIPGNKVAYVGQYHVLIKDADGNTITDYAMTIEDVDVVAGEIDIESSRLTPPDGSPSQIASEDKPATLDIIARDVQGNLIKLGADEECPVPPADPCPQISVQFIPAPGFKPFLPEGTVIRPPADHPTDGVSYVAQFDASIPGTYVVTVTIQGQAMPPYEMTVTPRNAPYMVSARMADNLGSIVVKFSEDTNMPGVDYLSETCETVLAAETIAKLGKPQSGATKNLPACVWSDPQTLQVFTGVGPTIMPRSPNSIADKVMIKDNAISAASANSYFATGGELLLGPVNPVLVTAVLNAPATVGVCDDVVLNAGESVGAGGRQLQYRWYVSSSYDTAGVQSVIEQDSVASGYSQSILTIPSAALVGGGEWTFTVEVSNFLGSYERASATVFKATQPVPIVSIQGPSEVHIKPSMELVLEAVATLPADECEEAEYIVGDSIMYTWSVVEGPQLKYSDGLTIGKTRKSPRLTIEANTLKYGSVYHWRVETNLGSNTGLKTFDEVVIHVGYDDITDPDLGFDRTVMVGSELVMNVEVEDLMAMNEQSAWQYDWECVLLDGSDCPDSILLVVYENDLDTLTIPSGMLEAIDGLPTQYTFSVTVAREPLTQEANRRKTTSTTIIVSTEPTLGVVATAKQVLERPKFSSTFQSVLSCSVDEDELRNAANMMWPGVSEDSEISYKWTVVQGTVITPTLDGILDLDVGDSTSPNIVIRPDMLVKSQTYLVKCTVSLKDAGSNLAGASGYNTVGWTVNGPPTGGYVTVTPTVGEELVDRFYIKAVGWTDEDMPIRYTYYWSDTPNALGDELGYTGYNKEAQSRLVPLSGEKTLATQWSGIFEKSPEVMYIYVMIEDSYGAPVYQVAVDDDGNPQAVVVTQVLPETVAQLLSIKRNIGKVDRPSYVTSRSLLQTYSTMELQFAAELIELVWDPAYGTQDSDSAYTFLSVFGRMFGGNQSLGEFFELLEDYPCAGSPELLGMKDGLVADLTVLDSRIALSTGYMQQYTCSTWKLMGTPSELSALSQEKLLNIGYDGKLIPSLESYLADQTRTSKLIQMLTTEGDKPSKATANCFHSYLNNLMRAVDAKCRPAPDFEEQMEERNQLAMDVLYAMGQDLGIAVVQEVEAGQRPVTLRSHNIFEPTEFSLQANRKRLLASYETSPPADGASPSDFVSSDMLGVVPGIFEYAANITNEPTDNIVADYNEVVNVVAFGYNGVNPVQPSATEDGRASPNVLFGLSPYVLRGGQFAEVSAAAVVEIAPGIVTQESERVTPGTYMGLRYYDREQLSWLTSGVTTFGESFPVLAYLDNFAAGQGYGPYLEDAESPPMPSPPPPNQPPPPPSPVPTPPPAPPLVEKEKKGVDVGIIIFAVAGAVGAIALIALFVIIRRRRALAQAVGTRPGPAVITDAAGPTPSDPLLSPDDEGLDDDTPDPEAGEGDGLGAGDTGYNSSAGGDSEGEHEIM
eukprot:CAMPEP_0197860128 /NCGR_PEP_ID=MMETSP1438-20131217/35284_1 /TAXON_ID=1461541 /ORGANISM="Pterosperma sp., Strain CCMP1384" /LENGTH=2318 /DNA_ID=CAMNT_0043476891 /DNA_START=1 /DNA_END=6957 /DNA_ORIENTATION=+